MNHYSTFTILNSDKLKWQEGFRKKLLKIPNSLHQNNLSEVRERIYIIMQFQKQLDLLK
jgi:hypothetical protein